MWDCGSSRRRSRSWAFRAGCWHRNGSPPENQGSPPVLLIHGTADDVVPFDSMAAAETGLKAAGVPVETLARPGLPHGIDEKGVEAGAAFLLQYLGQG